jgi:hypothetical protein
MNAPAQIAATRPRTTARMPVTKKLGTMVIAGKQA